MEDVEIITNVNKSNQAIIEINGSMRKAAVVFIRSDTYIFNINNTQIRFPILFDVSYNSLHKE